MNQTLEAARDLTEVLGLVGQGRLEEAVYCASVLAKLNPGNPKFPATAGAVCRKLPDLRRAEEFLRQALAIDPAFLPALNNLSSVLIELQRFAEAEELILAALARDHHPEMFGLLELVYKRAPSLRPQDADGIIRKKSPKFFRDHPKAIVTYSSVVELSAWIATARPEILTLEAGSEFAIQDSSGHPSDVYRTDDVKAIVLTGSHYLGGWDFALSPNHEVLAGSGYMDIKHGYRSFPIHYSRTQGVVYHPMLPGCHEISDDALFLSAPMDLHYGHWFLDFLPRLRAWKTGNKPAMKVAIPKNLPLHHRDTLALFGVKPNDLVECDIGHLYRFRSLTVCTKFNAVRPSPQSVKFLRNAFLQRPGVAATQPRRLYVQRSATRRGRMVANESELIAVLAEFGFQTIRRPELSISQQNELFNGAEIIVGVFGTDLLSAFQMPPGSQIVSFHIRAETGVEGDEMGFQRMCAILGVDLHSIACDSGGERRKAEYHRDIIADCSKLRACLQEIVGRRRAENA